MKTIIITILIIGLLVKTTNQQNKNNHIEVITGGFKEPMPPGILIKGLIKLNYVMAPPKELHETLCKIGKVLSVYQRIIATHDVGQEGHSKVKATIDFYSEIMNIEWLTLSNVTCKHRPKEMDINNITMYGVHDPRKINHTKNFIEAMFPSKQDIAEGKPHRFWDELHILMTEDIEEKPKETKPEIKEEKEKEEKGRSGRKRRGLIDAGGHVLNFLFGTATDTEVNKLNEQLRTEHDSVQTLSRKVEISLDRTNQNLKNIATYVTELKEALVHHQKQMLWALLLESLNSLETLIRDVHTQSILVDTITTLAASGKVHPGLLRYEVFKDLLEGTAKILKLHPIFSLDRENYRNYLKITKIHLLELPFAVQLEIPLFNGETLTTYRLHSFPTMKNNKSELIELAVISDLILIGTTEYSEYMIEDCFYPPGLVVCPTTRPTFNILYSRCSLQLIKNDQPLACHFNVLNPLRETLIRKVDSMWFVNLAQANKGKVICNGSEPTYQMYEELLLIPESCSYYSDQFTVIHPPTVTKTLGFLHNIERPLSFTHLSIPQIGELVFDRTNRILTQDMAKLERNLTTLSELTIPLQQILTDDTQLIFQWLLLALIMAIIIGVLIIRIRRWMKRQERRILRETRSRTPPSPIITPRGRQQIIEHELETLA